MPCRRTRNTNQRPPFDRWTATSCARRPCAIHRHRPGTSTRRRSSPLTKPNLGAGSPLAGWTTPPPARSWSGSVVSAGTSDGPARLLPRSQLGYENFLTTFVDKPDRLFWLAARFGEVGLPNAQLKLGNAALNGATSGGQVSILDVPTAHARLASPLAFPDLVTSAAKIPRLRPAALHQSDPTGERLRSLCGVSCESEGSDPDHPPNRQRNIGRLGRAHFRQKDLFIPNKRSSSERSISVNA